MADQPVSTKELRALPEPDLQAQLSKLREALWQARIKAKTGALPQTHQLSEVRRQIARVQTIVHERASAARQTAKAQR